MATEAFSRVREFLDCFAEETLVLQRELAQETAPDPAGSSAQAVLEYVGEAIRKARGFVTMAGGPHQEAP